MALSNVALFGGAFLTPVFVGKITHTIGWQWTFYLVAIFMTAALPFLILFVPETAFRRPDYLNIDYEAEWEKSGGRPNHDHDSNSDAPSTTPVVRREAGSAPAHVDQQSKKAEGGHFATEGGVPRGTAPRKQTFREQTRLFSGRKTDENFFKLLLRPFPLFLHPGILWVCFFPCFSRPKPHKTVTKLYCV
jgi:MFS family permease